MKRDKLLQLAQELPVSSLVLLQKAAKAAQTPYTLTGEGEILNRPF